MAKKLRNTARLLGKEIELETYFNRSNTITTTTTSGLVKGTVGWGFYSYDENNPEESFYAFDHYILGRAKTYAKGRRKMEDLKTAFAKLPLSAFTLTDLQPSLQLKQYITLSDRVANQLGGGKFLRPASIKVLEASIKDYHKDPYFKEGHMCIVRKVPLLFLFLFSKENRKVLHPFIKDIVKKIVGEKEVEMGNLVMNLQRKQKEKLKLTDMGKTYFYELVEKFFLKCLKKNSFQLEKRNYATKKGDVVTAEEALQPEYLFRRAYEHLCWTQETHFKDMQYRIPFVVSSLKRPFFLSLTPQSLVYLSLETIGDNIECNACEDGKSESKSGYQSKTFYGRTWSFGPAERTDEGNTTGLCVRLLDNYLEALGISSKDAKSGILTSFLGSWESAEKRIKVFRKEQEKRYGEGKHMNLFDYYSTLITLHLDYNVKFFAGLSNQRSTVDEKGFQEAFSEYYKTMEEEWRKNNVGWKAWQVVRESVTNVWKAMWALAKPLLKYGTLLLYKLFQLILNSPFLREMMLKAVNEWVNSMCLSFSVDKTKQKMEDGELKTLVGVDYVREKDGVLERFFYDEGRWVQASEEEKKEILEKDRAKYWGKFYADSTRLLSTMADYVSFGRFEKAVKTAEFVNSSPLTAFLDGLAELPVVGVVFKTVGTVKIKAMLMAYAVSNGNRIFSEILERNMRKIDALYRFTILFMQAATCLTGWGSDVLLLKDGQYLGGNTVRIKFQRCFENALHNIPYYALLILIQEEKARKSKKLEYIIKSFVEGTIVGSNKKQEKKVYLLAAGEDQQKRFESVKNNYETLIQYFAENERRKRDDEKLLKGNIKRLEQKITEIFKNNTQGEFLAKKLLKKSRRAEEGMPLDPATIEKIKNNTYWQNVKLELSEMSTQDRIIAIGTVGLAAYLAAPVTVAAGVGAAASGIGIAATKVSEVVATAYAATVAGAPVAGVQAAGGATALKTAATAALGATIEKVRSDPQGTVEFAGMTYMYTKDRFGELKIKAQNAYDTVSTTPPLPLKDVLKANDLNRIIFDLRLRGFIAKFRGKGNDAHSSALQERKEIDYLNARGIVASKGSIFVAWPDRHEFLDLDAINDFFRNYGPIENLL